MSEIMDIIADFRKPCPCGRVHETTVEDIRIGSGILKETGKILEENCFSRNILLVADKNTLKAADGILDSLKGFNVSLKVYDNIRVADMKHVEELEELINDIRIKRIIFPPKENRCMLTR